MSKKINVAFFIVFVFILASCSRKPVIIFVSPSGNDTSMGTKEFPLQTIQKAFEKALASKTDPKVDVSIHLLEGDYYLTTPLLITDALNNISLIGDGVDKVSIKGSKVLPANWQPFNENIMITNIDEDIDFDQLFINGEKQILARYPNYDENGGYWNGSAADAISKERVASWKNPMGGFVHAMHKGRWGDFHYEISGVDSNGELKLVGGHQNNRPSSMHPEYRMVENIFEELDSKNEWYFDKENHKLYWWNDNNTDLNSAKIEVSILKNLIEIKGSNTNPVRGIRIEGIRFQHTQRTFMEAYHPLLRSDWTIYRGGAILLDGTVQCSVTNCEFTNLGGNVIFCNGYNRNIAITENHIHHCGASAICFVGDTTAVRSPSYQYSQFIPIQEMDTIPGPANDLYPYDCKVENNLIYKIGQVEKQVAGVQVSMAMKIHIKNNSIYDVPRAGINVSEGTWGGHVIEFNDVFSTVLESNDHGSFNSWGRDRLWYPDRNITDSLVRANPQMPYWDAMYTTIIRNNRFSCSHGWDIDLDDGSSNYHIYNNLCLNGGIKLREGYYRVVENNIMINNSFHPHVWFPTSEDIFRKNIMMTKYRPIRLKGWGKEVDYNLFPDSTALALAHENNTDKNSLYGNPLFADPEHLDFTVQDNSLALTIGFQNFAMDRFGVQTPELKSIAKQPNVPELITQSEQRSNNETKVWLGGTLKNIETPEEQSAVGLQGIKGVIVLSLESGSKLASFGIKEEDVIVGVEGEKIKNTSGLLNKYKAYKRSGSVRLEIIRNQEKIEINCKSK
jgi:hypothetical protein